MIDNQIYFLLESVICFGCDVFVLERYSKINTCHITGLFLYPLKSSENRRFSDVLSGYTERSMAWSRLISVWYISWSNLLLSYKENRVPFDQVNYEFDVCQSFLRLCTPTQRRVFIMQPLTNINWSSDCQVTQFKVICRFEMLRELEVKLTRTIFSWQNEKSSKNDTAKQAYWN